MNKFITSPIYKIRKRFLRSYLSRWPNLNRWIPSYKSAGIYTVNDVLALSDYQLTYIRKTIPGVGDKGYQILKEIRTIARNVKDGYTYFTHLGNGNLKLKCLN